MTTFTFSLNCVKLRVCSSDKEQPCMKGPNTPTHPCFKTSEFCILSDGVIWKTTTVIASLCF